MTSTIAWSESIGIGLAGAIVSAWLAIHLAGIFFWDLTVATIPWALPLIIVQTWLSTGLFIVAHDAIHGSLAPGRPALNRTIGTISLTLYAGLSYRRLARKHAAHHRHVGTAADPDFHAADPRRFWPWFAAFFRSYYTHAQIARITAAASIYLLLGASLSNIILFWAIPAVLALMQLFIFGTYLPHRHQAAPFADHHRARSSAYSSLISMITCFHFGGYHHEHHLYPSTPWWRLPALRQT